VKPPVEAPRSRQVSPAGLTPNTSERAGKLQAAARDVRVRGFGLDDGGARQGFRRLGDHLAVGRDQPGGDGGLRGGAAAEMAEGDKHLVGAVCGGGTFVILHAGSLPYPGARIDGLPP
jgi:hypothetical protein